MGKFGYAATNLDGSRNDYGIPYNDVMKTLQKG